MTVRKAIIADAEAIAEAEAKYIDCPWSIAQIQEEIQNPSALFLTAEDDRGFIGYLSGVIAAGECEVSNIAVETDRRRSGAGSLLLKTFIAELKNKNVTSVFLLVRDGNIPAMRLYEKHGFTTVGKRPHYYKGGDALIMRFDI